MQEIFWFSKKQELAKFEVDVGMLTYYQTYEATIGSGDIDIDKLLAGQFEIVQSFDFSQGTFKKITGTEVLLGIEYSASIDEYNSISASVKINHDGTMSAEYQITTKYTDGFSLAITTGVETN